MVNSVVSLVALMTFARLLPYYQSQHQALHEVETSLDVAEEQTKRLRADFSRSFDPTQTSQVMQENAAYHSEQLVPIVLVDPLSLQGDAGGE